MPFTNKFLTHLRPKLPKYSCAGSGSSTPKVLRCFWNGVCEQLEHHSPTLTIRAGAECVDVNVHVCGAWLLHEISGGCYHLLRCGGCCQMRSVTSGCARKLHVHVTRHCIQYSAGFANYSDVSPVFCLSSSGPSSARATIFSFTSFPAWVPAAFAA